MCEAISKILVTLTCMSGILICLLWWVMSRRWTATAWRRLVSVSSPRPVFCVLLFPLESQPQTCCPETQPASVNTHRNIAYFNTTKKPLQFFRKQLLLQKWAAEQVHCFSVAFATSSLNLCLTFTLLWRWMEVSLNLMMRLVCPDQVMFHRQVCPMLS